MSPIRIRPMTESDLDQVVPLEQKNFSRPWSRKSFLEMLSSGDAIFLAAVPEEDADRFWDTAAWCSLWTQGISQMFLSIRSRGGSGLAHAFWKN